MKKLNVLIIPLLLSGCVPWPHFQHHTPSVEGVLAIDGKPARDVLVVLSTKNDDENCDESVVETKTDENGRFELPETSDMHFFIMFGDRINYWSLCAYQSEQMLLLWRSMVTGARRDSMAISKIDCEIGKNRTFHDFWGYCQPM